MSEFERSLKVLVVDDNKDHLFTLNFLINKLGHEVVTAQDGYSAIEIATSDCQPALILLDIGMPGIHGDEVCRQIKSNPRCQGIVIIAISGYGDEIRDRVMQAGFDRQVIKPIDPDLLEKILNQVSQPKVSKPPPMRK